MRAVVRQLHRQKKPECSALLNFERVARSEDCPWIGAETDTVELFRNMVRAQPVSEFRLEDSCGKG